MQVLQAEWRHGASMACNVKKENRKGVSPSVVHTCRNVCRNLLTSGRAPAEKKTKQNKSASGSVLPLNDPAGCKTLLKWDGIKRETLFNVALSMQKGADDCTLKSVLLMLSKTSAGVRDCTATTERNRVRVKSGRGRKQPQKLWLITDSTT